MQFQKLVTNVNVALAIATIVGLPSASYASAKHDVLQQLGLQTTQFQITRPQTAQQLTKSHITQSQATQSELQASISTTQARQTFFSHPLDLVRAAAFPSGGSVPSTYQFTLTIPEDAGQPLRAVTITQATNVETVQFNVTRSRAFIGRRAMGSEIQLASVGSDQPANPGEATIVFDQPVQPGNTITIALAARRNPLGNGVYLFGVTAYPDGENGLGQFLGYGRIHFYGNSH
jgi:hypothetical protein